MARQNGQNRHSKMNKSDFKAVAINCIFDVLIAHFFETETELLKTMPWCKRWQRETFDKPRIRYHSKQAIEYWDKRKINDPIKSTAVYHKNGKKHFIYN